MIYCVYILNNKKENEYDDLLYIYIYIYILNNKKENE